MSTSDDFDDVIAAEIPDELVEELIRGAFEPELPPELVRVGRVLRTAHGPIPGEDRAREAEVVLAMVDAMGVTPLVADRPSRLARRRVVVAAIAAASVFGVGGVAAAAGSLPTPIQSFVHDSLSHVGVSVPSTDDEPPAPPADTAPETTVTDSDIEAPRHSESEPGQSGTAPGQSGNTPGQSGNTPGQSGSEPPGQSGDTPGQSGDTPGQSGDAPGQSGEAPGRPDEAPGQAKNQPDDSAGEPGSANGRGQSK